ncbi:MAG: hypothetical protein J6P14_05245 [Ruminococcus sp.]|nr:hypothetical protein [Ruminococcus sp.]
MDKRGIIYSAVSLILGLLFALSQHILVLVLMFVFSMIMALSNKPKMIMYIFDSSTIFYTISVIAIIIKALYFQVYDSNFLIAGMIIIGVNIIGVMVMLNVLFWGGFIAVKKRLIQKCCKKDMIKE